LLERSYGLFTGYAGKIIQKVSEWMPAFDIVKKSLKGHACTDKYGCTA
jgi:hypothetical protein